MSHTITIKGFTICYGDNEALSDIDVEITNYFVQKPNRYADSPDDYYGYTELDYTVTNITVYEFNDDLMDFSKEGQILMFPESYKFTEQEYEELKVLILKELEK